MKFGKPIIFGKYLDFQISILNCKSPCAAGQSTHKSAGRDFHNEEENYYDIREALLALPPIALFFTLSQSSDSYKWVHGTRSQKSDKSFDFPTRHQDDAAGNDDDGD